MVAEQNEITGKIERKRRPRKRIDLSKVGERDSLPIQREPHWQRLRAGCFLGFRRSKRGGAGTWIARVYDEDSGKYRLKSLGDFGELSGNARFAAAKDAAENLAKLVEAGGEIRPKVETVGDACREYLNAKPSKIAEGVFRRHVYGDPIALVKLDKLRRRHLSDWRRRLENAPAIISRKRQGEVSTRERAASTVNRDMAPLRAALRRFLAPGTPPDSEAAWQEALKAIPDADRKRTEYLNRSERQKLVRNTDAEAKPFVHALCLLPLRPGAMAGLKVGDFNKRTSKLTIGYDKDHKPREIPVPAEVAKLLNAQAKDKLPGAPLFMRVNGKPWDRNSWKKPISAAVAKAGLPGKVSAYTLRHSTITDLVKTKLPLLYIAQISGTSLAMIEKHYAKLDEDAAVKALAELAL